MNNYKRTFFIFIALILLLMFISCKAKKTIETHSTDTIYKTEIVKITPAQLNSLIIDSPCDSLGQLKPFNYTFASDNVKGTVKSYQNAIKIDVNVDSIKQSAIKEYKSSNKTSKKTIPVRYIPKWVWYLLTYSVLSTLWMFKTPLLILIKKIII